MLDGLVVALLEVEETNQIEVRGDQRGHRIAPHSRRIERASSIVRASA
jgi:hypothetical protein